MRKFIMMALLCLSQLAVAESKDIKFNVPLVFEVSGGTAELDQNIKSEHIEHPLSGFAAGRYQFGPFQLGVCYLAISHSDKVNSTTPPSSSEIDANENFTLTSLCTGLLIGNFLLLNGGYGYATFSRSETTPYATGTNINNSTYNANGLGWIAGGSLIPLHLGDHVSIGATGYYFDATASDFSSDTTVGSTSTSKASGNGSVHTFGWYAGLSIFVGL